MLLELETLKKEELLDEKDQVSDIFDNICETVAAPSLLDDEHSIDLKASAIDLSGRNSSSDNGKRL